MSKRSRCNQSAVFKAKVLLLGRRQTRKEIDVGPAFDIVDRRHECAYGSTLATLVLIHDKAGGVKVPVRLAPSDGIPELNRNCDFTAEQCEDFGREKYWTR